MLCPACGITSIAKSRSVTIKWQAYLLSSITRHHKVSQSSTHVTVHAAIETADVLLQIALDDVTLDDIWCLDLNKFDGWKCVKENTSGEIKESLSSDEDDSSNDSDSDS